MSRSFLNLASGSNPIWWCLAHLMAASIFSSSFRWGSLRALIRAFDITKNAPYAWGNFRACAITRFQKPQQLSWAGRGQRARCSSINTCAVGPRPDLSSQRCCKLRLKLLLVDSTGKEDLKADRRVRHYKEVGLQEWPLAGRATIPRVLYGISLCMSLRRRTILSKSLRAPARSRRPHHSHFSHAVDGTAGRRFAVVGRFGKR